MNIEWWVYTSTEETEPYSILKMNLYLNASKPIDGSTLYWGVSFLKKAGSMLSYDVVLCNHTYFEEHFQEALKEEDKKGSTKAVEVEDTEENFLGV